MTGQDDGAVPVIIVLPAEIDMVNAEEVRDRLVEAASPGVAVVVADLTNTTFCDTAGFRELSRPGASWRQAGCSCGWRPRRATSGASWSCSAWIRS
jgi:anti-anti-sigma regulatory factor